MRRKKLLFYAKGLNPGGPEIALVSLLGQLSPEEYDVDLILFDNRRAPGAANLVEKIPDWVNVYDYVAETYFNTRAQEFPVLEKAGPYQLVDFTQKEPAPKSAAARKRKGGKTGKIAEGGQNAKGIRGTDEVKINKGKGGKAAAKPAQPTKSAKLTQSSKATKSAQSAKPIRTSSRSMETSTVQPIQVKAIKTPVKLRTQANGSSSEAMEAQIIEAGSVVFVETQSYSEQNQGDSEQAAADKAGKKAGNTDENKAGTKKRRAPGRSASRRSAETAFAGCEEDDPNELAHLDGAAGKLERKTARASAKKRKNVRASAQSQEKQLAAEQKAHLEGQLKNGIDTFLKGTLFRNLPQRTPVLRESGPAKKGPERDLSYSAYEYARAVVADQDYDWAFSYGEWVPTSFVAQEVQAQSKAVWVHGDEYSREELANLLAYEGYYEKVVFASHYISEKNTAYIPLLADKAVVVHNFCDNEPLKQLAQEPVEDLRLDERPLIVTIANIRNEKNCMKLLDVAQGLKKSGVSFHWVCVNNFPDETLQGEPRQASLRLCDKVRKKSAKLNLDGDISWINGTPNPYKYLKESHVLASLSDSQSWCSAIPEAKILGIPVVATRTGDALEQITDSVDGILTDFSVDEICGALRSVLKDKALQRRIRKNLQELEPEKAALEHFTHLVKRKRTPLQLQAPQHRVPADVSEGSISGKGTGEVAEKAGDRPGSQADKVLANREGKVAKAVDRALTKNEGKVLDKPDRAPVKNEVRAIEKALPKTSLSKTPPKREGQRAKSGRLRHIDNRTLIVLDNVNYIGGSHRAVRNLLQELNGLDISVFTAVMPTMATLKEWGHVKFVFPPDELWEAHLLPDLLCEDEPRKGLGYALKRVFSRTQTWLSNGRELKVYWKRLVGRKRRQLSAEYELRRKFSQYDTVCVIGEDSAYREIVANCSCRTKIAWIYTDYAAWKNSGMGARIASRRDAYIYARFSYIVFTSQASREGFVSLYPQLTAKTRVIGNALPVEAIRMAAQKTRRKLKIVTIARLDAPKGMDRMLRIAARLIYQGYDFTWNIVGSGPQEASLKKKVKAMNIQGYVNFLGEMANPYCVLGQADLFALFSEYEGLPNAVFEALILGIPVIATRVGGVTEQVVEGKNGWLVGNNEEEILKGLRYIMDNPEELDGLTNKMPVYCYDNADVIEQVQDLFL
ncbi:MAG: glycosyltransferase [Peptococcaceae bacterium]|nr:glycosyltransferase [Peptococcaceae bacterium]